MKFDYRDYEINLLDTPGHQDFSEDTYRVLTAVDSALMVIDCAKGVETQTEKLMEVCRMRNTPIITFINKLDQEGKAPLDILDDIEDKLQIECTPLSWPIGMGKRFKGVYNLFHKQLHLFSPGSNTRGPDGVLIDDLSDPVLDELLGRQAEELRRDIELIEGALNPFEMKHFLNGSQTPVFFGSAINNFGVKEMLDAFVEMAPPPGSRAAVSREVSPYEKSFSGFAFKIQANMNPAHRDRVAHPLEQRLVVGVDRHVGVTVVDDEQVAEAPHPVGEYHLAMGDGVHRRALLGADEHALGGRAGCLRWSAVAANEFPAHRQAQPAALRREGAAPGAGLGALDDRHHARARPRGGHRGVRSSLRWSRPCGISARIRRRSPGSSPATSRWPMATRWRNMRAWTQ